jgi:DNA gyrase subunit A
MSTKEEDVVTRLFVANTHTPVLFFSSRGIAYREKVWRLPIATPQSGGKFLRNLLPLQEGERITSIMPMPDDEKSWGELDVMFATTRGTVRRNKLSDFAQVNRNGKIAMKLEEEGDEILGVETCTDNDDVLLTASSGQCIRFSVSDVRVFQSRNSVGVRGIAMADTDRVISMAVIEHVDATPAERAAYLRRAVNERRLAGAAGEEEDIALTNEEVGEEAELSDERYEFLRAHEQFVLTVTAFGYGKRSSSYDFRLTGRGGKGIRATDVSKVDEIGRLVATFPVGDDDQIMLVSDGGTVIRVPVAGIRIASRATKGVTIFNTAEGEKVVSVERISEPQGEEENGMTPPDEGAAPSPPAGEGSPPEA